MVVRTPYSKVQVWRARAGKNRLQASKLDGITLLPCRRVLVSEDGAVVGEMILDLFRPQGLDGPFPRL
eukprot:1614298-Pyramimonas_sp.AAC.1